VKTKEIEDRLMKVFLESRGPRDEIHLSDTCHCEMKAYNRLTGMEPIYTKRTVGFLVFGEIAGLFVQQAFPPEQREYESTDIVYSHVDVLEDFKFPIEGKASAKKIFRASDVPEGWQLQLMRYMAKHNAPVGWLSILNLFSRALMTFKMTMALDERMKQLTLTIASKERIEYARQTGDTSKLIIIEKECPGCFHKPSKKRREAGLGDGCPRYVKTERKKSKK